MSDRIVFEADKHYLLQAQAAGVEFTVQHWHGKNEKAVHLALRLDGTGVDPLFVASLSCFPSPGDLREFGYMLLTAAENWQHHQGQLDEEAQS